MSTCLCETAMTGRRHPHSPPRPLGRSQAEAAARCHKQTKVAAPRQSLATLGRLMSRHQPRGGGREPSRSRTIRDHRTRIGCGSCPRQCTWGVCSPRPDWVCRAADRRGVEDHHDHVWVVDGIPHSLWAWFGFGEISGRWLARGHGHEMRLHKRARIVATILLLVDVLIVFVFSFPANSRRSYASRPFPRHKRASYARTLGSATETEKCR
jgi:hypothetical protein